MTHPNAADPDERPMQASAERASLRQRMEEHGAMISMPSEVELCQRIRDNHPCLGRIFRPTPEVVYCPACGGTEPGTRYVRKENEK